LSKRLSLGAYRCGSLILIRIEEVSFHGKNRSDYLIETFFFKKESFSYIYCGQIELPEVTSDYKRSKAITHGVVLILIGCP